MSTIPYSIQEDREEVLLPIWNELLVGSEYLLLKLSPVYWGIGIPRGDGAPVVVIPGFMGSDLYLWELRAWLMRIGYRAYLSGIGVNADCPDFLIQKLNQTIDRATRETGRKVHLLGHSLGGVIARSAATQTPDDIASVITLASPFRGTVGHPYVLQMSDLIRERILRQREHHVERDCYTAYCTCGFVNGLRCLFPPEVPQTAIYTKADGIVDWRYCVTDNEEVDLEVPGSHMGLVFNPLVYRAVAERLAA